MGLLMTRHAKAGRAKTSGRAAPIEPRPAVKTVLVPYHFLFLGLCHCFLHPEQDAPGTFEAMPFATPPAETAGSNSGIESSTARS